MPTQALSSKQLIEEYVAELTTNAKTEALMDRYISDQGLKQHIRETEAAFPGYIIEVHQMVAENDTVALRGTFRGTQRGAFMGVPPTGKDVSAGVMLFYRIAENRIAKHWMQFDAPALWAQLNG